VDVRVVAATNRDLKAAVASKEFREDLYFRLSVLPVEIPPLRRRRGDILLLAERFLDRYAQEMGRKGLKLSEAAKRALLEHSWPGNVRELQNCLERSVILCPGILVEPEHLRIAGGGSGAASRTKELRDVVDLTGPLADVVKRVSAQVEQEAIALALSDLGGDRTAAAARLGISVATLNRRLHGSIARPPGDPSD
jgi:DNA-binding NtrC family response regulator